MLTFIDLSKDVGDQSLVINFKCEVVGFRFLNCINTIFNRVLGIKHSLNNLTYSRLIFCLENKATNRKNILSRFPIFN